MNLAKELRSILQQYPLLNAEMRILVAVSGGVDSMVLLHLLNQLNFTCEVAHVNYGLRGNDSEADEQLVAGYCQQQNIRFHSRRFDTLQYAEANKLSVQMAARELRYQWFESLCTENKLDRIATAHHADDQAETVLLKLLRGSGPAGLSGIRLQQGRLIRPLLYFEKKELLHWAEEHSIPFRTDSSNLSNDYQRNFLRNEIIPKLKTINPGLNNTLSNLAGFMNSHQQFLEYSINKLHFTFKNPVTGFAHIQTKVLSTIPGYDVLLYEMLQPFSVHPGEIENICRSLTLSGKKFLTPTHIITVGRNELIVSPVESTTLREVEITSFPFNVNTSWGNFHGIESEIPEEFEKHVRHIIYVDLDRLQFPLKIRSWKEGDTFQPSGMQGRKKLSDFFTEKKLSLPEKGRIPLLFSGNDLIWVCNMRMDQRFTLSPDTRRVLQITFMPGVSGENVI